MCARSRDLSAVKVTVELGGDVGSPLYAEEQGGGALGNGWALVRRFRASVDDPGLGAALTLTLGARDGRLAVEEAVIRRSGAAPLNSAGLRRVALDSYVGLIRKELRRVAGGLLVVRARQFLAMPEERGGSDLRQSRQSQDEILRRVVGAYLAALKDPEQKHRATAFVAEQLGYSRAHVGRLLVKARRPPHSLLGPAHKGRTGQQVRARRQRED